MYIKIKVNKMKNVSESHRLYNFRFGLLSY